MAAGGRIVSTLRGRSFSEDERSQVHKNLTRIRTTAYWMEKPSRSPLSTGTGEALLNWSLSSSESSQRRDRIPSLPTIPFNGGSR
ncbi:DUF6192 family protein [Actinomadura nitritigenes]|uniref:DUF6192 family protein n=1 Tax=Actinomadura nitritigenes TaxID=134602 RepID=UPI003D8E5BE9